MEEKEIQEWKEIIDVMPQIQMARMVRFSPPGHPVFNTTLPLNKYFYERFDKLGGMTPSISKKIG